MSATLEDVLGEVAALRRDVALLVARAGVADPRLATLLPLIHAYAKAGTWTAGELLEDALLSRKRELVEALDAIAGDSSAPAKRFGRWLQRHAGAVADGFRLVRVKREGGAWLYSVELGE